ncbi:MAG: hypothetical protein ACFFCM_00190 [Promethearchaeota archaeon]
MPVSFKKIKEFSKTRNLIYKGKISGTVLSDYLFGYGTDFLFEPEISIEGVPNRIYATINPMTEECRCALIRVGDKITMEGVLSDGNLEYWGVNWCFINAQTMYNETIKSGIGIRINKTKKTYFKGEINGKVTSIMRNKGSANFTRGNVVWCYLSIGLRLDEEILGIPEELTVHLEIESIPYFLYINVGDALTVVGEIYGIKMKDIEGEILEMQAQHYLNKTLDIGI